MSYPFFPLMINLEALNVLIIGGGHVASRRAETLLRCGAVVRAVSPVFIDSFPEKAEKVYREFASSDVSRDFALIFAASDNREVNHEVYILAKGLNIPVNVCDSQGECDFFFPSLINHGCVAVSVSSGGTSSKLTHKISNRLRQVRP
ncbi:MAG: NAD(P)-dependent oxidoreductase [Synergistaceae bacterium]|nr:NAD(P)-dependent oxidoreductase [Synergistaceae bacterium]